jgi:phenylpropionate dioxygenase-like ring-hydroxylating dioxygenase large terminal subunit
MLVESPRALLPVDAYRGDQWFDREQQRLFADRWVLVASVDELTAPGDFVTTVAGRSPLVVVRGHDGELRAFHNICRHRGAVLLQGSGAVNSTVNCFYHQWRYQLDGALVVVPQRREQFPTLDLADWGLLPASVALWQGMVFAHPAPIAPPLLAALEGIPENLGSHQPGLLRQVATAQIEAKCNWKLFVENHIDVYHLWYLHADTLGDYDHTHFQHHFVGSNWVSYEALKPNRQLENAALIKGTAPIRHLATADRIGLRAQLVFPNLMIATSSEFWATYVARPVTPDRSVIDLRIRAEPEADAEALLEALHSFIVEDIAACEAIQQATGSPAFAVGPLAQDHERPITTFHSNLLAAMAAMDAA